MTPNARPSVVAVVCLMAAAGLVTGLKHHRSHAEEMPEAPPGDAPAPAAEAVDYFKPYPTGPGAIPFAELLDQPTDGSRVDTKDSVAKVAAWADSGNGAEVHEAWAAYSLEMQKLAELGEAEYIAGLEGVGEAGLP